MATKPESKLWQTLSKNNPKLFIKRVENTIGKGMPDVYFAVGVTGWCELKCSHGKRNRLILNFPVHQRRWLKRHHESGGCSLLCVSHDEIIMWFIGQAAWEPERFEPFHTGPIWPTREQLSFELKKCPAAAGQ